jgi:hypothetical protein
MGQAKPQEPLRTAVLETRLIQDSLGCPAAVDLWLVSTTDTIQGFEVVLQWDRPDDIQFLRGKKVVEKKAADSLAALLMPTDPKTQIDADRTGTLVSKWEFVEARSTDGRTAKILGVAKLFGQDDPVPVIPGQSGSLLRIPLTRYTSGDSPGDSTRPTLSFDPVGTRLSTHRGLLFGPLTLRAMVVEGSGCP